MWKPLQQYFFVVLNQHRTAFTTALLNVAADSHGCDFPSYSQWDALFHCIAYGNFHVDWDGLCDQLRDVPWEDIFKLSASAAASKFCEWVQVFNWCIYQVSAYEKQGSSQNSEAIDVWKVTCQPPSWHVMVCDDYSF